MEVKGRNYDYLVEPSYGKIRAEVYKIIENPTMALDKHRETHIHLAKKTFGKWYRGITDQDYKDAREWAEAQLKAIYFANR